MSAVSLRRFVGTALARSPWPPPHAAVTRTPPAPARSRAGRRERHLRAHQPPHPGNLGGGGNGLPVTFHDGSGSTLTFKSGELVLAADGSYTLEVEAEFNGGT